MDLKLSHKLCPLENILPKLKWEIVLHLMVIVVIVMGAFGR